MSKFTIKDLHQIMTEVNAPNEYVLIAYDLNDVDYWIYHKPGIAVREISARIQDYRQSKFDVFIDGLYISDDDYVTEQTDTDFFVKFKRANFPTLDGNGASYFLNGNDITIEGDLT